MALPPWAVGTGKASPEVTGFYSIAPLPYQPGQWFWCAWPRDTDWREPPLFGRAASFDEAAATAAERMRGSVLISSDGATHWARKLVPKLAQWTPG